jgi:hypothetical protein
MESPNVGIALQPTSLGGGEYWIENLLIEGTIRGGGIYVNVGAAAVYLRHVIMYHADVNNQPQYGIQVTSSGELIISDCDIAQMGICLSIVPGQGQYAIATYVSNSFFDNGRTACVYVAPTGDGFVSTMRFANVWTSTGIPDNPGRANGFSFVGLYSTPPPGIEFVIDDVSLVNCLGQGFVGNAGLYAHTVHGLSITSSTFGGNFNGIQIAAGTQNFVLAGNMCGNYVPPPANQPNGNNTYYGIYIDPGASDHYVVVGNLLNGNTGGALFDGGTGSNKAIANNVG